MFIEKSWNLNPYPWILGKKFKTQNHHRASFAKKKSEAQHWEDFYMFLCFEIFFQKWRSATVPKNGINFCSARHISHHIGICQYDGKYAVLNKNLCHFLGPWPSVISGKKFQSTETYRNLLNAALRIFFSQKTLGDGSAFWIFSPGFTDKG